MAIGAWVQRTEKGVRRTEKGVRRTEKRVRRTEKGVRRTEKGVRRTEIVLWGHLRAVALSFPPTLSPAQEADVKGMQSSGSGRGQVTPASSEGGRGM